MHRHDLDLIAALAEGSLEDESLARARVDSCAVCRAELEAQSAAIAALGLTGPAEMTEHEKAALHRDLWTALTTVPASPARVRRWSYRWSYAAAGLFVVVGLVAVLNQANTQEVAETFSEVGAGLDQNGDGALTATQPAADKVAEGGAEDAPTELARPASDLSFFVEEASRLRAGDDFTASSFASRGEGLSAEDASRCLDEAGLIGFVVVGTAEHRQPVGGYAGGLDSDLVVNSYVVAIPEDREMGPGTPVSFVDIDTCALAHVDE